MQKIFIRDFALNETVSTTFLVKSKELRNKKAGGQFGLLTLTDRTGEISGQFWDNFEDVWDTFKPDDVIFVRGLVNTQRGKLQMTVHRIRPCSENEIDLTHYFPVTKYDVEEMFAEMMQIINALGNPFLRQLLTTIFADKHTVSKFKRAPAARSMHHPFLGGLLEHTLSLVKLCRTVGSHYEGLDVDLLITGGVLHDFGKIDELSYERGTTYTNDGQMIGHLVMETIMVSEQISRIPSFPEELRRHLLHLLLAHHGKLEYGSPKLPVTPEALMLAYLDDLDSKVEAMQRLIAEPHASGDWTRMTQMFDRAIYRRRTIEAAPATEAAATTTAKINGAVKETTTDSQTSASSNQRGEKRVAGFNTPFATLADLSRQ
jgi:3'-5' exoribonuclease